MRFSFGWKTGFPNPALDALAAKVDAPYFFRFGKLPQELTSNWTIGSFAAAAARNNSMGGLGND
jgi:hypothetical protein